MFYLQTLSRFLFLMVLLLIPVLSVQAQNDVPNTYMYNGHLLDPAGNPITAPIDLRFSFWTNTDYVPTDTLPSGGVNTGALDYAGWIEVHTITTNADGYFSVILGETVPLPSFAFTSVGTSTLQSLYLQVDAKMNGDPLTSYELLDCDITVPTRDRSPILSVPFAHNASFLNGASVGVTEGDIALLGTDGVFNIVHVPWGTNYDSFTLDADGTAGTGDSIELVFGSIANILSFDIDNDWFNFNNDVNIDGDLTVTGLINGVDVTTLFTANALTGSHLEVYTPHYSDVSYTDDGTNNVGQLLLEHDIAEGNFYRWRSTRTTLQDYTITMEHTLPLNFLGWDDSSPFEVRYRTSDTAVNSALDIELYDTSGTLVGSALGLSSSGTWDTATFIPVGTWNPGEKLKVVYTPYALTGHNVDVGDTRLMYTVINST
jgi:hypothetical protein